MPCGWELVCDCAEILMVFTSVTSEAATTIISATNNAAFIFTGFDSRSLMFAKVCTRQASFHATEDE
jgi:hypothetical protein